MLCWKKRKENVVYDGVYTIDGKMWHASAHQPSMGNAALLKPMQVVVSTDKETGKRQQYCVWSMRH